MVSAVGDPDLSGEGENRGSPLADALRAGNGAAIAWFKEGRRPRVRAYVAHVCPPEHAEDAVSAAFDDFLARTAAGPIADDELDALLLAATRSAAAGRFAVIAPPGRGELAVRTECHAMPELLATHANRERPTDEGLISSHLSSCAICAHTLARMQDAERAFAEPAGELVAIDVQPTVVRAGVEPVARAVVEPATREARPKLEPERSRTAPIVLRRRTGGVVGAVMRLGRAKRG